jgi:hypothetical protein
MYKSSSGCDGDRRCAKKIANGGICWYAVGIWLGVEPELDCSVKREDR